ncbi:hypothetical protein [Lentisalinibacter salinarum]|uniref:hypothetical protein n=1 Tax=Lentisalinibacter salinarum TaxID=2992239 RepID=UPI00386C00A4
MTGKVVGYHPLIPEGEYLVRFTYYETGRAWKGSKAILHFAVVEGEYAGTPLTRYYNVRHVEPPLGRDGKFSVGDRCHLVKEFRSLLSESSAKSEIDLNLYRGWLIRACVGTTNQTGLGEDLTKPNQYSVIRKLLEIVPESLSA